MKSILSFSILLISALSVHGQTGNKKSNTEQEIRKLSNDWMVAMMKRDSGTLNRIVAPEFELGGTDFDNPKLPPPVSRETWMKNTMQNLKVDSVRYITMKVRIIENVAIVQSAFYWSATFLAQPVRNDTANLIDTWIKRKQGWQVVNRLVVDPIKE